MGSILFVSMWLVKYVQNGIFKTFCCRGFAQVIGKLTAIDIEGGVIVLDSNGNISMEFNTDGMARAYRNSKGDEMIAIYK
ncbi:MAG: hypothetical protein Ct9H300mP4_15080 [Gammaproteobacteria bacterium]|nr:MAG: hypothetical protein Ct9H300mP4_15080 [Gammaproteobacteria bacterium]